MSNRRADDGVSLLLGQLVAFAGDGQAGHSSSTLGNEPVDLALEAFEVEGAIVRERRDENRDAAL